MYPGGLLTPLPPDWGSMSGYCEPLRPKLRLPKLGTQPFARVRGPRARTAATKLTPRSPRLFQNKRNISQFTTRSTSDTSHRQGHV